MRGLELYGFRTAENISTGAGQIRKMSTQFTINNIASMERWPEKSAGVLRPFCGRIALIFLDFWLLFCQEKSKKEKTVDQNKSASARIIFRKLLWPSFIISFLLMMMMINPILVMIF